MCAGHVEAMRAAASSAASAAAEQPELDAADQRKLVHAVLLIAAVLPEAVKLPLLAPIEGCVQQELRHGPLAEVSAA